MAQWLTLPDGSGVNFDNARIIHQSGSNLIIQYQDGSSLPISYNDATAAQVALPSLLSLLQQSQTTGFSGPFAVSSITPNTGTHGTPGNSVLIGNGFAFDILTASFGGTVTIGVDVLTYTNITYVNNNTLLLSWTPTNAGTFDVIYKRSGSTIPYTITNGFTAG